MDDRTRGLRKKIWFGDYLFDPGFKDVLEDFRSLGSRLNFEPVQSFQQIDGIALINFHLGDVLKYNLRLRLKKIPRIHIVTEPTVTVPALHRMYSALFPTRRITMGKPVNPAETLQKPCPWTETELLHRASARSLQPVIVNANKYSWVFGENYTLRREVLSEMPEIVVYGTGWSRSFFDSLKINAIELIRALAIPSKLRFGARYMNPKPKNYLGTTPDKLKAIANHKICLAIENSFEMVTEKLTDSWFAGCIPVYVGPSLTSMNIPSWAYLQAEPTVVDIRLKIEEAKAVDVSEYLAKLEGWLNSQEFLQNWGHDYVWTRILRGVL